MKVFRRLINFFVPVFIVLVCFFLKSAALKDSILVSDMGRQYVGFFSHYQDALLGRDSFFYSFSNGLGASTLMDFYYYLGSPFNVILLFFSKSNMTIGILMIVLMKIGLSGLTMSFFLKKRFNLSECMILVFSTCYALMSYNIHFYFNVMWLDSVYLIPLIIMALDRLIDHMDIKWFVVALAINILISYYTAYMNCIFCFLYFFWRLFYDNKQNKFFLFGKFASAGIWSLFLSAIVIIPLFLNLNYGSRPHDYLFISNIKEFVQGILMIILYCFPFTYNLSRVEGSYNINIYSGLLVIIFVLLFFLSNIGKRKKVACILIFLFFCLSFLINYLNAFWHGFTYPIGYHFRFSYLVSFFVIIVAADFYSKCEISTKSLIIAFSTTFVACFALMFLNNIYDKNIFLISMMFVVLYAFLFYNSKKIKNKILEILLFLIVIVELFMNTYLGLVTSKSYDSGYINNYESSLHACPDITTNYRVNMSKKYFGNITLLCGVKGTGYTSSNVSALVKKFYQKIGAYASSSYYYLDGNNTDLAKSLLGVKYIQTKDGMEINDDALSVGFMIYGDIIQDGYKNVFEFQNLWLNSMLKTNEKVLVKYSSYDSKKSNDKRTFKYYLNNYKNYFAVDHDFVDYVYGHNILKVYVNGQFYTLIGTNGGRVGIINISDQIAKGDTTIELKKIKQKKFTNFDYDNLYVYYEDKEILDRLIRELSKNQMKVTKWDKNVLEGTIDVNKRKILFLSIPYEKGWNIYVDGKRVEYFKLYDTFIGIKLNKGHHNIKMKYYPPGLKIGMIISGISYFALITCTILKRKRDNK